MSGIVQTSPYLRNQRNFPNDDLKTLSVENDRAYIDIATKVNERTIGVHALNGQVITGEQWYFQGPTQRQQSLRQIYSVTGTGNIPHGLNWDSVFQISPRSYGAFTDGTNWYGMIFDGSGSISSQVTFYVTPTDIVVTSTGAAPTLVSGTILLEWISVY